MTPDDVEAVARARTGLDDFGPDEFREGLAVWLDAALHAPVERPEVIDEVIDYVVDLLANRLRVFHYVKSHPQVVDEKVDRPLVIMGMPRSGTTMLSYLLDQDPHRRSLLLWEATDSVPPPLSDMLRTDPRCLELLEAQRAALREDPIRFHMEWADGPTECLRVHAQDLKGLALESRIPVPDYSRWLEDCDMTSAYEYERLVLQVLQSKAPGVWSLKMPSHALFPDYLLKTFPDARLVWTHRDPYRALGSVLDMKAHNWERACGNPAIDILLDYYPPQMGKHVQRPLATRDRIGGDRIYNVHYMDLVRDPLRQITQLYDWAGDELTPEAQQRMQGWLAANPGDKHGAHDYSLDQFGRSKQDFEPYFRDYLAEYDIESETV